MTEAAQGTGELISVSDASPDAFWVSPAISLSSEDISPLGLDHCHAHQVLDLGCGVMLYSGMHTEEMQDREGADWGWFSEHSTSAAVSL